MAGLDILTLSAARKYTDETVIGGGAIKGKNCVITQIEDISGGHRVHFSWTLDDGTVKATTMDVMDGMDGVDGKGIYAAYVVGSTPYAADWLSLREGGEPLVPVENNTYVVVSDGAYINTMFLWDGTQYVSISGAGTNVEANPVGEATEDLTKLRVGNTIYDASKGGRPSVDNEALIFN